MLYLIATPIGNLADFSQHAISVLRACDLILCEDTRHSRTLLQHHRIDRPLLAFHQFNEKSMEERVLRQLKEGRSIALISDAGTPLISDPGHALVRACIENDLPFTAIPGPCSIIQALVLSGFDSEHFQFIGFLPRKQNALESILRRALFYQGTTIAFESPERLCETLEVVVRIDPQRRVALARELTKMHEECVRATASEILNHFQTHPPRGEFVILIEKGKPPEMKMELEELVKLLQELHGLSLKEAITATAKLSDLPKKTVYQFIHHSSELGSKSNENE